MARNTTRLARYIHLVLRQVHPDLAISKIALQIIEDHLRDLFGRVVREVNVLLLSKRENATVTSREIQSAVRLIFPGELARHAVSEGVKAVTKYTSSTAGGSQSRRAGLQFPVARYHRFLKAKLRRSVAATAAVYMAAVMEYEAAEIMELAGNASKDLRTRRMTPRHVLLAIRGDEELDHIVGNAAIRSGGVIPHIHKSLILKRCKKSVKKFSGGLFGGGGAISGGASGGAGTFSGGAFGADGGSGGGWFGAANSGTGASHGGLSGGGGGGSAFGAPAGAWSFGAPAGGAFGAPAPGALPAGASGSGPFGGSAARSGGAAAPFFASSAAILAGAHAGSPCGAAASSAAPPSAPGGGSVAAGGWMTGPHQVVPGVEPHNPFGAVPRNDEDFVLDIQVSPESFAWPREIRRSPESDKAKVIVVGDGGCGKTCWVSKLLDRSAEIDRYIATIGVQVRNVRADLSNGKFIDMSMWDTAGQEKFGGLRDGYYIMAQAAVIMFDVTSRITYKNVPQWYRDVTRVCENIPIVLVGSKADAIDRRVKPKQVGFNRKKGLPYVEISAKTHHNLMLPLQLIAQALLGDQSIRIREEADGTK